MRATRLHAFGGSMPGHSPVMLADFSLMPCCGGAVGVTNEYLTEMALSLERLHRSSAIDGAFVPICFV